MSEFDPERSAGRLGPEGQGFDIYPNLLDETITQAITEEILQPVIPWLANDAPFHDEQGRRGEQIFSVFAHKISRGSQDMLPSLPQFSNLARIATAQIVAPLQKFFPNLENWQADEISAQRYPDGKGELGWHRDNSRHPGIIVTASIEGEARLGVEILPEEYQYFDLTEGDVFIQRAPGLFQTELPDSIVRKRHSIVGVSGNKPRTSITIRANSIPDKQIRQFHYYNWPRLKKTL